MTDLRPPVHLVSSPHCERNQGPLLDVLREQFPEPVTILEIGSGTGQHAVFFARNMPWIRWIPSDRRRQLGTVRDWVEWAALDNVAAPVALDVVADWPRLEIGGAFSANTTHIMPWHAVEAMFQGVAGLLPARGRFCLYGPFECDGRFASDNDRQFDAMLRSRDPLMGLRAVEDLQRVAADVGLEMVADYSMPANNHTLVWQR